jgi:hypothetical protein
VQDLSVGHFVGAEVTIESLGQDAAAFVSYMTLLTPIVRGNRTATRLFVESSVVLLAAWHEELVGTLAVTAAHEREALLRAYLAKDAAAPGRTQVAKCDRRELIEIAKRRMNLRDTGTPVTRFATDVWGFDPWPDDASRRDLSDLNLLRQLIIHRGGGDVGDSYWSQLSRVALLSTSQYPGLPPVRQIDHAACIAFLGDAFRSLLMQAVHIQRSLRALP